MTNAAAALSILGGSVSTGSAPTTTALAAFSKYKRDPEGARRDFYERQDVQKSIKSFQTSASEIKSVEDFLKDRKTLEFVLTSFGLESELNNPGKLKAIINSDPDDPNSYSNRLADPRYGEFTKFLNVKNEGFTKLKNADAQTQVIDDFLTNAFEVSIGFQNPAAREAVFFLRRINEIDSSLEILGDLPLRSIVTTALSLPAQIANQSILKQQSLLDAKLDFDKLNTLDRDEDNKSKTKLDLVNDDLGEIKKGLTAVTNASVELTTLQTQLSDLRVRLQDIDNVTNPSGVLANEIPVQEAAIPELIRQQGLIAEAERALLNTDPNLTRLDKIFKEAAGVETQEELDSLKSEFDRLVTEITGADGFIKGSSYTDTTAGTTENLLIPSGDVGSGIDALPSAKTTTIVKSDGTAVVTSSVDLSGFLTDLDNANTAFQGVSAVDDGLKRLSKAAGLITEIRGLAFDAQADGADIDQLNAAYTAKLDELTSLINEAGTATDGTNTFTFDNLLTGGTISYQADATSGKNIDARGGSLDITILGALPGSLTAGNANSILTEIDTTVTDSLSELKDDLVTDRKSFDFAANVADPLGSVDAEIRQIRRDLDNIISRAGESGNNLLGEFASDLKVVLGTLSTTITVDAQNGFKDTFDDSLSSLQYVAVSGGAAASRETILNDALFAVGSTLSRVNAEKFTLNIQNSILSEKKATLTNTSGSEESLNFLKPLENTNYALKFIEQYLIKKDLEAVGGTTTVQPKNASLVGLFQDISGGGGLLNLLS